MKKVVIATILVFIFTSFSMAQTVPLDLQVKFILKILSMDKNFARYGDPVTIGVSSDKALSAFKKYEGKLKVKGKQYQVVKMSTLDDISKHKAVFVDTNWKDNYTTASTKAQANKALMFAAEESGVISGGAAISFKVVGGKPKIMLNLTAVAAQGAEFPSGFLKITVVVGNM